MGRLSVGAGDSHTIVNRGPAGMFTVGVWRSWLNKMREPAHRIDSVAELNKTHASIHDLTHITARLTGREHGSVRNAYAY
jgi:hypothetical protein